jgi:PAS domain-containing protein
VIGDAVLSGVEVSVAWWIYRSWYQASRRLLDPKSASLFLLLVPGMTTGLFAVGHAALLGPMGLASLLAGTVAFWLSRALGLLALVPPALILVTPVLVRRRLIPAEPAGERSRGLPDRLTWGDGLEITGLAAGSGLLGLLLLAAHREALAIGWVTWSLPILLTVWASLRQGSSGATVVATTPVLLMLLFAPALGAADLLGVPLQGHLLAQCSTALLIGASFSWVQASEVRYRQLVGHIPVVLYSARLVEAGASPDGPGAVEVTFVSPASRQLFGSEPEQLLSDYDAWLGRVHSEDRELVWAALAELALHQRPVSHEYRLNLSGATADGSGDKEPEAGASSQEGTVKWVRDTLVPRVDDRGRLAGWEGMIEDITERRLLANDLRRTTSMLNTLVAHLPAGVFFVQAPTGRPVLVNARARQLLGKHEDRAAGLEQWPEIYRLHRPDGASYPAEELPVCTALRHGITSMREDIVVHRPDGRRVRLVAWAAPLDLKGKGEPDAAVCVLEDLTALRRTEAGPPERTPFRTVIKTMAEALVFYEPPSVRS